MNDIPEGFKGNPIVLMDEYIAHTGNLFPRYFRMPGAEFRCKAIRGFAKNNHLIENGRLFLVIRHEGRLFQVSCIKENTFCSMGNIQESGIISVHRLSGMS